MRVVIADDTALLRQGIARLLVDAGIDVVGEAGDAPSLLELVADLGPDVAVVDIRMPPGQSDEGLVAADTIRAHFPDTGVLVLSQYVESAYALRLLEDGRGAVGTCSRTVSSKQSKTPGACLGSRHRACAESSLSSGRSGIAARGFRLTGRSSTLIPTGHSAPGIAPSWFTSTAKTQSAIPTYEARESMPGALKPGGIR